MQRMSLQTKLSHLVHLLTSLGHLLTFLGHPFPPNRKEAELEELRAKIEIVKGELERLRPLRSSTESDAREDESSLLKARQEISQVRQSRKVE